MRYLEDCVEKLKKHAPQAGAQLPEPTLPSPSGGEPYDPDRAFVFSAGNQSPDVEMTSSSQEVSPTTTPNARCFQRSSLSPALLPEQAGSHTYSSSSSASASQRHQSFSTSATTSPTFGPQPHSYPQSAHSASDSVLTSPALPPQRDLDREATAALLMLNQTDRRGAGPNAPSVMRGMSVRDLLSS